MGVLNQLEDNVHDEYSGIQAVPEVDKKPHFLDDDQQTFYSHLSYKMHMILRQSRLLERILVSKILAEYESQFQIYASLCHMDENHNIQYVRQFSMKIWANIEEHTLTYFLFHVKNVLVSFQ